MRGKFMKKSIKILLIVLVTISVVITYTKVFTQDIEEDPFPDCFRYVGDPNKRGNVKNATEAFDLLLNQGATNQSIINHIVPKTEL